MFIPKITVSEISAAQDWLIFKDITGSAVVNDTGYDTPHPSLVQMPAMILEVYRYGNGEMVYSGYSNTPNNSQRGFNGIKVLADLSDGTYNLTAFFGYPVSGTAVQQPTAGQFSIPVVSPAVPASFAAVSALAAPQTVWKVASVDTMFTLETYPAGDIVNPIFWYMAEHDFLSVRNLRLELAKLLAQCCDCNDRIVQAYTYIWKAQAALDVGMPTKAYTYIMNAKNILNSHV